MKNLNEPPKNNIVCAPVIKLMAILGHKKDEDVCLKKAFDMKTEEALVMLHETVTTNSTCDSELHNEHLCFIISQGFHLTDEQEYKALIEESNFRCDRCHRTAKSGANLCVPVPVRD